MILRDLLHLGSGSMRNTPSLQQHWEDILAGKVQAGVVDCSRQQEVGEQRKGRDTLKLAWKSSLFSHARRV